MKHFTEYLIDSGRLSQAQLLEAFVKQLEATPPVAAIVFRHGLLSEAEQLVVMGRQADEGLTYQQACSAAGLWTSELAAAVDAAVRQSRPGLAQAIAAAELVDGSCLRIALAASALERQIAHSSGSDLQLELQDIKPVLLEEFIKLAHQQRTAQMLSTCKELPLTAGEARKQDLAKIKGQTLELYHCTEFIGCPTLSQLLIAVNGLIDSLADNGANWQDHDRQALLNGLQFFSTLSANGLSNIHTNLPKAS